MRRFIRLGDKTSHGGTVTSASSRMYVGGLPVACIGDTCTCPKKGHGNCVIVEGDDIMTVDGRAIALEGCKCSCGAVLISSMPNAGREYDGGGESSTHQTARNQVTKTEDQKAVSVFDEQFMLKDKNSGAVLPNRKYRIIQADGQIIDGVSDSQGRTQRVKTKTAEKLLLQILA